MQEKTSSELSQKITRSNYQFKRKGNEIQYTFNSRVEESISAAKKELKKIKPGSDEDKESLQKASNSLDEGIKAIEKRQKHIKVADSSEFGWTTVQHYDCNLLAESAEDKKCSKKLRRMQNGNLRSDNKVVVVLVQRGGEIGALRQPGPVSEGDSPSRKQPCHPHSSLMVKESHPDLVC